MKILVSREFRWIRKPLLSIIASFCLVAIGSNAPRAESADEKTHDLALRYSDFIYGPDRGGVEFDRLVRWVGNLEYMVLTDDEKFERQTHYLVDQFNLELSKFTDFRLVLATDPRSAGLAFIIYDTEESNQWKDLARSTIDRFVEGFPERLGTVVPALEDVRCLSFSLHNRKFEKNYAAILMNISLMKNSHKSYLRCFYRSVFSVLGPWHAFPKLEQSPPLTTILDQESEYLLSDHEWNLLYLLYSNSLTGLETRERFIPKMEFLLNRDPGRTILY